jgi:Ca2+-binding RTX toxin-like protein
MQTDAGDPKAGLTEEERAGRDGHLAPPASGATQTFRPVALDLDGDGIETIARNASNVSFDVEDSGYLEHTGWLKGDDAFLTLDRNYNGQADSGRELFSNGAVDISRKGLAGLAWVDANYDGKITVADPVWNELRVWQDANENGQQDAGETLSLNAVGITELNYSMGAFQQNGQAKQLASPDLEADTEGTRVNLVPEGILVQSSANSTLSLLVTRIDDLTALEANRDGVTSYEDVETIISGTDLLANDTLGGFTGRDLSITGLANFRHGTGFLDVNGFVHFAPEANYAGADAGFDYIAQASNGQEGTGGVDITLQNVNDAPTLDHVDHSTNAVYGYVPLQYDENGTYVSGGQPIYQPYAIDIYGDGSTIYNPPIGVWSYEYHTTVVAYEDSGAGRVAGADVDDPVSLLSYEIVNQPQYGAVTFNADGTFQYTSWKEPGIPSDHIVVAGQYASTKDGTLYTQSNLPGQAVYPTTDVFQVKITDPHGATTTQSISVPHFGPYLPPTPQGGGGGGKKPIAVDLNGNGFEFVNVDDSNVFFDMKGDGWKHRTSWVAPGDGLLAYDSNGDGKIDKAGEISFVGYKNGAQSDLEGLAAFDSNGDGRFSAADEKWSKFGVWQDANQNGVTDPGEFRTLEEMGVSGVNLTSDGQFSVVNGQTIHGVGAMDMVGGNRLAIADVTLAYSGETQVSQSGSSSTVVPVSPFSPSGEVLEGTPDNDLILGKNGNNIIYGYAGDDVIFEDGGNDVIDAGDGNDLVYSGADNDLVMGGAGDDAIYAGLGDDLVFGGDGNDAIFAEGGNDVVFGGAGNDLISGGTGNDVLSGDAGDDQVYGESGNDALFGRDGNDELSGMDGADRLDGGAGNDLLDGGAGADDMLGGTGDDTYVVDDPNDVVTELTGEGNDTVRASIDYVLPDNVENLTLTGTNDLTGTGNSLDNVITGNSGNNTLLGEDGNDILIGGIGADTMIGGAGDDTYIVDNAGDVAMENAGDGMDTVRASIDYTLAANAENLVLTGMADLAGTGNELDNVITGNVGNNVIDGGAGADTLSGGAGDDSYVVDNAGDVVNESLNQGVDTIYSSVSYALPANVENLVLTGTADIDATGNELGNVIVGNSGNNTLVGKEGNDTLVGGGGADTMLGGNGNDTYIVDNAGDVVIENAGEGIDTIYSSVSYVLPANVENLTLTGTADIDGTGNELDNVIAGNVGNNVLDGGAGADTLIGGAGNDTYIVDNAGDVVIENTDEGIDAVLSSITYALTANVENLTLTGAADIDGTGNELDNIITGNVGNNVLDGGAGADTMIGGAGNDTYIVDNAGDVVIENVGEGIDVIYSSVSYALPANVENLVLTGTADIDGSGNDLDNVITGNVGNNVLDGGVGADTLIGGAGNDTYIVDNVGDVVIESAGEGIDTIYSSVSYALPANVENLVLTGTADIDGTGNDLDNVIAGNVGNNVIDGGAGADTMIGGAGDDTYVVDHAGDVVIENANEGIDTVSSSITYALTANVENLSLTGTADIGGTGNDLDNVITGNVGNNVIDGGAGADTMIGGAGDDTYVVDNAGDVVIENANEGIDTVSSSITYALTANVENLTLTGAADIDGTGNDLDNVITGNVGNNVLDGGAGADSMIGGAGNDTYIVDNAGDVVIENAGEGIDTIYSSVSYVLPANVENLTLTGAADIDGTGNELDNVIAGNVGNNVIDGGAGADTMVGGAGNDTYIVDNAGDVVIESLSQGVDTIYSSVSYVLPANVENLVLTGTADIDGTGNELDNVITGNVGNNVIDGGAGADTLIGGAGNDTYIVDNVGDVVIENAGEGIDTIYSSVSYVLPANVENLTLTGAADIDGTGNELDNVITGNVGNNVINGGAGADTLIGGGGNDTLVGGTDNDYLNGGLGNDVYSYNRNDGLDMIADAGGTDELRFGQGLSLANVAIRVTSATGVYTAHMRVLDASGCEQPDQGADVVVTVDGAGHYVSPIERFAFADGSVNTFNDVLIKTQITYGSSTLRNITTGRNDDIIYAYSGGMGGSGSGGMMDSGSNTIHSGTGNDIVYAGNGGDSLYGEGGDDYLQGGGGNDLLNGGCGINVLDGLDGNDTLQTGDENVVFIGGTGYDTLTGGAGSDFIAGGRQDDTIGTGAGNNVVAFNRYDGHDTMLASAGASNTLSLGGGIAYSNLVLQKSGNDLILKTGMDDSVKLKDWYVSQANHNVVTLQVIEAAAYDYDHGCSDVLRNQEVETFDFAALVAKFDQARAANPTITSWAVAGALLDAHLASSSTAALGGDLAYWYGMRSDLGGMNLPAAQDTVKDANFGTQMQQTHTWQSLNTGTARIA